MAPTPPTIKRYPLQKSKILKKTISGIMVWGLFLCLFYGIGVVFLTSFFLSGNVSDFILSIKSEFLILLFFLIPALALVILEPLYQYFYFKTYFYDVRTDFLVIRKGPITPTEITLTYDKIQDVFVDQDLLDRIFGLYDVHVSTATIASGIEAHIDGVNGDNANAIREAILSHIRKKKR